MKYQHLKRTQEKCNTYTGKKQLENSSYHQYRCQYKADDQYAIVQALLTDRFIIKNIIAAHFGVEKSPTSMEDSYKEIEKIIDLMDLGKNVPISRGSLCEARVTLWKVIEVVSKVL